VREDRRPRGVQADREVVREHRVDAVLEVAHAVAVVDHLVVGDEDEGLDAEVLQAHAVGEGAEVVADVQVARGAVAREHAVALGMDGQVGLDRVAAFLAAGQRGGVGLRLWVLVGHGDPG
jgi:hypothetical protein